MNKQIELLLPAGNISKGKLALDYQADAIYIGGKMFSLRARADNADFDQLKEIIDYAHERNKKVYIVTNILCRNVHLKAFKQYFEKVLKLKPDGFITADPFLLTNIRRLDKHVELHVSTQESVCNSKAALFFKRNDCSRVVLAREVEHQELALLMKNLNDQIEIEYFIHGALCIAYSGRCMMSNNFSLRDANVGGCAQSCRWVYTLFDENNHVYTNKFTMSPKDLNLISKIHELIDLKIASLKVEGRMKSEHYIATVTDAYRKVIDQYLQTKNDQEYLNQIDHLNAAENRETSLGWYLGLPKHEQMLYHELQKAVKQSFAFMIKKKISDDTYQIISKNHFLLSDQFDLFGPNHSMYKNIKITKIIDQENNPEVVVNKPNHIYTIVFNQKINLDVNDIGRINNQKQQ